VGIGEMAMFDTLNSRALRCNDCYGQRFMNAGIYHYSVLPADVPRTDEKGPFVIDVRGHSIAVMRQHSVVVRVERGVFMVEPATLTIAPGDLVLWNCPESTTVPYVVVGDTSLSAPFGTADALKFIGEGRSRYALDYFRGPADSLVAGCRQFLHPRGIHPSPVAHSSGGHPDSSNSGARSSIETDGGTCGVFEDHV
jgi:hypothetical protein